MTNVELLSADEARALWIAKLRGFLVSARPTELLLEVHLVFCILEDRRCVVLLPRPTGMWRLLAHVADLRLLPSLLKQLEEFDAWVDRLIPHTGVVAASVLGDRAEAVARSLVLGPGVPKWH